MPTTTHHTFYFLLTVLRETEREVSVGSAGNGTKAELMTLKSNRDEKGQSHGHPPATGRHGRRSHLQLRVSPRTHSLSQTTVEFHEVVKFTK